MAVVCEQPLPVFGAFESQLKTLCIKEFPCGLGSWREPDVKLQKVRKVKLCSISGKLKKLPPLLIKEPVAQQERPEVLEELVGSKFSPWFEDYSWSEEAEELRQIAVRSPWLIDTQFVLKHFRTLRIVDKGVTDVDQQLLRLQNLTELTLSANFISKVNSKHLPRNLRVLELCANEITDISELCELPPPLEHLGLGYNIISFIEDYITGDYWPDLLSLDLSNNNLTDLLDIVRKLSTLPKLRNLILIGNPLSLIPGYRGYTIDSMRNLSILDDIRITADEFHHFKGLARRREYILDEAKVELEVSYIKNLPVPDEIKYPLTVAELFSVKFADEQPEYPIVERKYYVKFMFVADRSDRGSPLQAFMLDSPDDRGVTAITTDLEGQELASVVKSPTLDDMQQAATNKSVIFSLHGDGEVLDGFSPAPTEEADQFIPSTIELDSQSKGQGQQQAGDRLELKDSQVVTVDADKKGFTVEPILSANKPWAEEIEMDWKEEITRFDLLALRDFLRQGMELSVVEEMVLCYPVEEEEVAETPNSSKKSKDGSKDKKDSKGKSKQPPPPKKEKKPPPSKKDKKPPPASQKNAKGKDKKKKKGEEQELRREPPQVTILATFHVPLKDFLEGGYEFTGVFTQGGIEIAPSIIRSMSSADNKKDKKDPKDKKKDKEQAGKKGKDGKQDAKAAKEKGKKGALPLTEDSNETPLPPPPLELKVAVRLRHWTTAQDSVKEEEKNQ